MVVFLGEVETIPARPESVRLGVTFNSVRLDGRDTI